MRPFDLLWFVPLVAAIAVVVGTAGRRRGEIAPAVRRYLVVLTLAVLFVGLAVRVLVLLFA